MWWR